MGEIYMKNLSVVILAAGEGTRMRSERPKVLHHLAGRPLVKWVLSSINALSPDNIFLVVGHKAEVVKAALNTEKKLGFVTQEQQRGSGHALIQAAPKLRRFKGDILVLCADTPLISDETLKELVTLHRRQKNDATILSSVFENPYSYGRIVRDPDSNVLGIVEEKDATVEQRAIKEINSGIYCFKSPMIWDVLSQITPQNKKNEYYLTDAIGIINRANGRVNATSHGTPHEIMGVNTRADLSVAESTIRSLIIRTLMLNGVTIADPSSTYISAETVIGQDTIIYPGTIIEGACTIGSNCRIGPYSFISAASIADGAEIRHSYVTESQIAANVKIGPFAHIRPGSVLQENARVGNFSEVKKSVIGRGSKVNHLSYIGDAELGEDVNIGAGTITCNYDGVKKYRTVLGDRVFVGSNTNLVAPVRVGAGVLIGAGSTITENVPENMLAIARCRQTNKEKKKK
jgi:bifunctional UDP-N-acetylglucosamine pyrophosphorylase/glucosamine-1-phosphate N-acetyltransferase